MNVELRIGGTAGCVIAGRLAKADPSLRVLIVEAGPDNHDNAYITTPAFYGNLLNPSEKVSQVYVSKASQHVGGRNSTIPQGAVLGGGGSVNLMMYTRASASDYDNWNTEGWSFNELKPLFKKVVVYV
jgi:alcohol oxidase